MTRRPRHLAGRATDREVGVVAAVLETGSEKAAASRLGLSHSTVKHHLANARSRVGAETTAQLVWILGPRLPEPGDAALVNSGTQHGREPVATTPMRKPAHRAGRRCPAS
jgi:DNA-binding CsgD family transcriptional regulator